MRSALLLLAVTACTGRPAVSAVTVASVTPRASVVLTTSAPAITEAPAQHGPTITVHTDSTQYDFRLSMTEPCPGTTLAPGCEGAATLTVLAKSGAELQRIELEDAYLDDGEAEIEVGDFDFDGVEDFAIKVNHYGPYGGATFAVFLRDEERFVHSEALSQLTQESLGFFQVDPVNKHLVTFAKSGCCYHVTEEHEVVHGTPNVVLRETEDATGDGDFVVETEERLARGKWQTKSRRVPR